MQYLFKVAETPDEYDQIRRLNHRVFAEEVRQHEPTADGRLIDSREAVSRFFIAVCEGRVAGMVCTCAQRPFSVEKRLADPSILDTLAGPLLEARLLAIEPAYRKRMLFLGLLELMVATAISDGFATLLISGITTRQAMYQRMGFQPLGPPTVSGAAEFTPMAMALPLPR
ncbi:GNAT family N-acyltransferase [uncultured Paludibaculum sp.]|uniref:GNAT family N-acetyltransferase n=1 Tax=uncultured Paludibaculum sp. TaxID=1765020 RepID=UPI002AAAFCA6|nr:GNAT family N-acetyltransferase [uncultured Paludibaculum sp.]